MKARDSVKNYPSALREMTNYSARSVKKICTEVGARPCASEQEFEAQKRMVTELEQCCDTVQTEEFKFRPKMLFAGLIVLFVLAAAMVALLSLDLMIPFFVVAAIELVVLLSIVAGKNIIALFFPKRISHNIIGIKKPENHTATRRIIFSAYCDSTAKKNPAKGSIGANRNLSGCFSAISVIKFLQRQKLELKNTEIWIVLTGSRNADSAGALAFGNTHKFDDMETIFIGLDTLYDPENIAVASGDESLCELVATATTTAGRNFKTEKLSADTKAVARKGIKAVCISANREKAPELKVDNADTLNLNAIESCIDIALETVFLYDNNGLAK